MKRYSTGPFADLLLSRRLGLRVETGVNYRRGRVDLRNGPAPDAVIRQYGIRAKVWGFPMLLKRRFPLGSFGSAGATLRRAGPFDWDAIIIPQFPNVPGFRTRYQEPAHPIRTGVTAGGGVRLPLRGRLHLEPELRYTHWPSKYFMPTTEQIDFLLGLSWGR